MERYTHLTISNPQAALRAIRYEFFDSGKKEAKIAKILSENVKTNRISTLLGQIFKIKRNYIILNSQK